MNKMFTATVTAQGAGGCTVLQRKSAGTLINFAVTTTTAVVVAAGSTAVRFTAT